MFIKNITDARLIKQAEIRIQNFENKIQSMLPDDFRDYIIELEAYIDSLKENPDIYYPDEPWYFSLNEHLDYFEDTTFELPNNQGSVPMVDIGNLSLSYDNIYDNWIKALNSNSNLIPFGHTGTGDYLCIGVKSPYFGKIFLWDHETQSQDNIMGNTVFICDSFQEFFNGLK